jgi:hypothetical protein
MVRIEVTAEIVPARGKVPAKQVIYAHLRNQDGTPQLHPRRMVVALWDGQSPYAAGANYTLAPESVYADKWDSFGITPKLVPIPAGRGGAS